MNPLIVDSLPFMANRYCEMIIARKQWRVRVIEVVYCPIVQSSTIATIVVVDCRIRGLT